MDVVRAVDQDADRDDVSQDVRGRLERGSVVAVSPKMRVR